MQKIKIIEVISEFGAGTRGSSLGIDAIRFASLTKQHHVFSSFPSERVFQLTAPLWAPEQFPAARRIPSVISICNKIVEVLGRVYAEGAIPFLLSGDHSNSIGTIAGIKAAYPDKRLGAIWIDAHADLHTPYSTPSGNVHGMPLAASMNFSNKEYAVREPDEETLNYWNELCNLGGISPKILPQDLVFIGLRSLEDQESEIISKNKIRVADVDRLVKAGAGNIVDEIMGYLADCDLIYVSFDVDSLDELLVPGTGTPVEDGISYTQAAYLLKEFWKSPKLAAMEITEVNPLLDQYNQTAEIAAELMNEVLNE